MELIFDSTLDALKDTCYLLPFLYLTYVLMEWLETKTESFSSRKIETAGKLGPAVGAILGLIPQCGFSATAATLYAGRVITRGTLIAVFLATSDEMLPIFIAKATPPEKIAQLLLVKLAIGIVFGYAIDIFLTMTKRKSTKNRIHKLCEEAHCDCSPNVSLDDQHFHNHNNSSGAKTILKSALTHTIQVVVFVFVITLALTLVINLVGEDALASALKQNEWQSVIVSAIFGLIPNCAASVAIADLWADGVLSYASMLSGLLTSAGIGILVLLKTNKEPKRNCVILLTLVLISIACGLFATVLGA